MSTGISPLSCLFLFLGTLGGVHLVEAQNVAVVIDAYPDTATQAQGSTLILVCRVVGVPSTTAVSYQWTCPGDFCDAGAVYPEWAARIQQGNILVVNLRNSSDDGDYTCIVQADGQQVGTDIYALAVADGLSLLNEDGGLRVFFPRNSFVSNTTLTHTNNPRGQDGSGADHFVCFGNPSQAAVQWYIDNVQLNYCDGLCGTCDPVCQNQGAVSADQQLSGMTDIHIYTGVTQSINQDLECRESGQSAVIGVYLQNGVSTTLQPPSSITQGTTSATTVSVSWSQVSGATGYYVSYQRQDLGTPPVATPQYERIVGGDTTSVTLSGLEPGTTYRIRVWSRDGTSGSTSMVSSMPTEMDVATLESAPTAPRMVTMIGEATENTIELNWLPSLRPNGAIHYEIEYEPVMTPGDTVNVVSSSSPYFTLILPNESVTYNVRVAAVNTQGLATSNAISVCLGMSGQSGPQPPTGVSVVVTGTDSAVVSWNAQQSRMCDVVIVNYLVSYQLSNGTGAPTTVVTSSTSVTLSDLVPNAEYNVSVAATNSNGDSSAVSTTTFLVTPTAAPAASSCSSVCVGTAVGGSIGGVLLITVITSVVVAALCVLYIKRSKAKLDTTDVEYEDPQLQMQTNPAYGTANALARAKEVDDICHTYERYYY